MLLGRFNVTFYIYTCFFKTGSTRVLSFLRTQYGSYALKKSFFSYRECFFTFCSNLKREQEMQQQQQKKTNAKEWKLLKKLDGFWSKNYLEILISARAFLNVKLEGFRTIDNILGQVDPRIHVARKWHQPVQNAIL